MKDELDFLRKLEWPIVKNKNKCIYTQRIKILISYFYESQLRYDTELTLKEKNEIIKNKVNEFLSNFRQITDDGTSILLGLGKMTPEEMDLEFGPAKNPNPGNTFFAGKSTRNKNNPPTSKNWDKEIEDALPKD